jgi:uncharacterized membrane protein YgcG
MLRIKTAIFASALAVFLALPVHAQGLGGFVVDRFDADIVVDQDAGFTVTEQISGEFLELRHGIFRYIPVVYTNDNGTTQSIRIDIESVTYNRSVVAYEAYRDGNFEVVKIGDADVTVDGPFLYVIQYRVERAMLYHEAQDELYWNVTGTDWDETIPNVNAEVTIPGVSKSDLATDCYTGEYGSTAQECTKDVSDGSVSFHANDFLTISVQFPKGVVAEPTEYERAQWWIEDNWDFLLIPLPLIVAVGMFLLWRKRGRDAEGRGTIIPEYDPPDGLRPTEIGTLIDVSLEPKDFSAAVVDLAVRGYLHISEEQTSTLGIFKNTTYHVRREKPDDDALKPFEREVLGAFGTSVGEEVDVTSRQTQLAAARKKVSSLLYQDMADRGYYTANPNTVRGMYIAIAIILGFGGYFIGGIILSITGHPIATLVFILSAVVVGIAGWFMPMRTEKGTLAWEAAMGFKMFLEKAEKYRIQWQEREGIFEKFLPYAMVFGVADKWSKTFEGIEQRQPGWYSGNMAVFNPVMFSEHMQSFINTTAQVSAPKSSGGGGGGGSSGGGFGGGGGGSW